MPEGDTLHNLAAAMRPDLEGRVLVRAWTRVRGDERGLAGRRVERVEALGKNLLVAIEGGVTLRSHLGLKGIWHRYARGAPWRRARSQATAVLETEAHAFVCFHGSQTELLPTARLEAHAPLARLGPDLMDDDVDLDAVVARALAPPLRARALAETLLDQTVAAGLGNVFKSEVLFLERLDPWTPTGALPPDRLRTLFATGHALLRRNRRPGPRVTVPDAARAAHPGLPRLWVYGRTRRPCLRCATPIRARRQGDQARTTYWCPRCQA